MNETDFAEFDYLFAADKENINDLKRQFGHLADDVFLMTNCSKKHLGQPVPDPYYGGDKGFDTVYEMLDEAISEWLLSEGFIHNRAT